MAVTLLSSPLTENQQGYLNAIWRHSTSSTSYPGDRKQLWHSQDWKTQQQTLPLRYKIMLGQLLPPSFSFCQYCLGSAFVSLLFRMVFNLLLVLFPRPHFFHADFLSFHGCKGICHPVHPVGGEKLWWRGKRESLHLSPFPMARKRTEKSKLSIVKARSEGYYSHLHQHPSDQLISLPNKENKVHKNIRDSWWQSLEGISGQSFWLGQKKKWTQEVLGVYCKSGLRIKSDGCCHLFSLGFGVPRGSKPWSLVAAAIPTGLNR